MTARVAQKRGVVLVETIVAAALLLVALGILAELAGRGLTESALAQRRTQGALLAQGKMEEILSARDRLAAWESRARREYPQDPEGDYRLFASPEWQDFRWNWHITPSSASPGLSEVVVDVYWWPAGGNRQRRSCQLRSLLATPLPKDTGEGN